LAKISQTIKQKLFLYTSKKVIDINELRIGKKNSEIAAKELLKYMELMEKQKDIDPLAKVYLSSFAMVAQFSAMLLALPELKKFTKLMEDFTDLYMPSYPPMSPITDSHYNIWELVDLKLGLGKDSETMFEIFIALNDVLKIDAFQLGFIKSISDSYMGLYQVKEIRDGLHLLREIYTGKEIWAKNQSTYVGKVGQYWYARVFPAIEGYGHHIVITTPYVLGAITEEGWLAFLNRQKITSDNFLTFMKYGPDVKFWNEYITFAYFNHVDLAIFLTGYPDVPNSLPFSDSYEMDEKKQTVMLNSLTNDDLVKLFRNDHFTEHDSRI